MDMILREMPHLFQYKNATKARNEKILKQLNIVYGKDSTIFMALADVMTDGNLLASCNSIGKFRLPKDIKLSDTNIIAFRGTVLMEVIAKKSTKYLEKNFPNAYIKVFEGNQHAELSVNQPKVFVEEIEKVKRIFSNLKYQRIIKQIKPKIYNIAKFNR